MIDESKVYIEDETCNFGNHIAKELYVIRYDEHPFVSICKSCLEKLLKKGTKLIEDRNKEELNLSKLDPKNLEKKY